MDDQFEGAGNTASPAGEIGIGKLLNLIVYPIKQFCSCRRISASDIALDGIQISEVTRAPDDLLHEAPRLAFFAALMAIHSSVENVRLEPSRNPANEF